MNLRRWVAPHFHIATQRLCGEQVLYHHRMLWINHEPLRLFPLSLVVYGLKDWISSKCRGFMKIDQTPNFEVAVMRWRLATSVCLNPYCYEYYNTWNLTCHERFPLAVCETSRILTLASAFWRIFEAASQEPWKSSWYEAWWRDMMLKTPWVLRKRPESDPSSS